LERRIHGGEDCFAEEYLAADPELAADKDAAVELISAEYWARQEVGRPLPPDHYYERFPHWRNELEALFFFDTDSAPSPARIIEIVSADGATHEYQFLQEISKTPNGTVIKARQGEAGDQVAIKTFTGNHPAEMARFRNGAREQKRLRHDNILPVHELGEEAGEPCFVMEFADAGTLDQRIAGKPQVPEYAARLVRTLAEAMSYAHGEGVVHCDLKPANVVLTGDNTPKITDFGLARRVDAPSGSHTTGDIFGTIPYMAPEQAAGRTREVGPLSDVYGLGTILYEMLTGQAPFQGTVVETLQQILHRPPTGPRRLQRPLPRGLESICLKCLEKKPRRRYASAQALADDLGRWVNGQQPKAHRAAARIDRFVRRHPALCTALALALLAALLAPTTTYLMDPERERERFERDLAAGKEVTLIGEKGPPKWSQWATSEPTQKQLLAPDGSFRIVSESYGLLELVRDPQRWHYIFSAWVRHDENLGRNAEVGIYFEYRRQQATETEHHFCVIPFNGIRDIRNSSPRLKGNQVGLAVRRLLEQSSTLHNQPVGSSVALPVSWQAVPDWRRLVVEVSSDWIEFSVSWKTRTGWEYQTKNLPRASIEKAKISVCTPFNQFYTDSELAVETRAPGKTPTALGLYVYQASASFHDVILGPSP
jgi:serine/threonine-protein kinase